MNWRPLYAGSKNPPVDQQVLLKAIDGTWGIGIMSKNKTFRYESKMELGRTWLGVPKDRFTAWALVTV